jgi:hypothetical protein
MHVIESTGEDKKVWVFLILANAAVARHCTHILLYIHTIDRAPIEVVAS